MYTQDHILVGIQHDVAATRMNPASSDEERCQAQSRDLAAAFDVEVGNGFAVDSRQRSCWLNEVAQAGAVVFRRIDGTLGHHPITTGQAPAGRVVSAANWAGSAFPLPVGIGRKLPFGSSTVESRRRSTAVGSILLRLPP